MPRYNGSWNPFVPGKAWERGIKAGKGNPGDMNASSRAKTSALTTLKRF